MLGAFGRLSVVIVATVLTTAVADAQRDAAPRLKMDDDFEYAVLDFGVGTGVPPMDRGAGFKQKPDPNGYLWVKVRITNLSKTQLASPKFWGLLLPKIPPTDNFGNAYSAKKRTLTKVSAPSGRYKPGESTLHLLAIQADELVADISELRINLGDSGGFALHRFFALKEPLTRLRDFDPNREDPSDIPALAGRSFMPPTKK